jgi:hypothetical protein
MSLPEAVATTADWSVSTPSVEMRFVRGQRVWSLLSLLNQLVSLASRSLDVSVRWRAYGQPWSANQRSGWIGRSPALDLGRCPILQAPPTPLQWAGELDYLIVTVVRGRCLGLSCHFWNDDHSSRSKDHPVAKKAHFDAELHSEQRDVLARREGRSKNGQKSEKAMWQLSRC